MKKAAPFLFLIMLFAVATWFFFTGEPEKAHELPATITLRSMPAEIGATVPPSENIETDPEPVNPVSLPLLNESDNEITNALVKILGAERLADFLVKDQVISRLVAMIDSLTSHQVPARINPIKAADDKFVADTKGEILVMSQNNFARYDGYIGLMQSVTSAALVAVYQHYYPLFQQAWQEIGGSGSFNTRLVEVIDHLLETPDVTGPVYLTRPEAVYLFENPDLEALTAGQKILVRMGSSNAAQVKEKLTETKSELADLPL